MQDQGAACDEGSLVQHKGEVGGEASQVREHMEREREGPLTPFTRKPPLQHLGPFWDSSIAFHRDLPLPQGHTSDPCSPEFRSQHVLFWGHIHSTAVHLLKCL